MALVSSDASTTDRPIARAGGPRSGGDLRAAAPVSARGHAGKIERDERRHRRLRDAEYLACTDDDVRRWAATGSWLPARRSRRIACVSYSGGPVRPISGTGRVPTGFPRTSSDLSGARLRFSITGRPPSTSRNGARCRSAGELAIRRDLIEARRRVRMPSLEAILDARCCRSARSCPSSSGAPASDRGARPLRPRDGSVPSHPGGAAHAVMLPALVVRQRRLARARRSIVCIR